MKNLDTSKMTIEQKQQRGTIRLIPTKGILEGDNEDWLVQIANKNIEGLN